MEKKYGINHDIRVTATLGTRCDELIQIVQELHSLKPDANADWKRMVVTIDDDPVPTLHLNGFIESDTCPSKTVDQKVLENISFAFVCDIDDTITVTSEKVTESSENADYQSMSQECIQLTAHSKHVQDVDWDDD